MSMSVSSIRQLESPPPSEPAQPPVPVGSFADEVSGQERKPTLDLDMALLSKDVYETESAGNIGAAGWNRVSDEDLLAAGIDPAKLSNESIGFQSAIYTDGKGNYVLAFAGTDPTSGKDWVANGGQVLGFDSAQYNQAMSLAQDAAAAYGDNLAITGHSLGGGLASAASLATGNPAVTFNAAGLSDETIRSLGFNPNEAREIASDGLIRRYYVSNDILTRAQEGSALPNALGTEYEIANTNTVKDPVRAHFTSTIIQGMEAGKVKAVDPATPANSLVARAGETGFAIFSGIVREGSGLVGDTYGVGKGLVNDAREAGRDLANGRPFDAAFGFSGDVAKAGFETTGNLANRGLNVAGDVVQGYGKVFGGGIRDYGRQLGMEDLGNTVGGWVEKRMDGIGNKLDTLGTRVESGLDTVGGWVSDGASAVGNLAEKGVDKVAGWVDKGVDAAKDAWNSAKDSKWNPRNWF